MQTFREPGDRVARFVRRLQAGIENGTIPRPTFAAATVTPNSDAIALLPDGRRRQTSVLDGGAPLSAAITAMSHDVKVTIEEAIDFAVRCGGHLQLLRRSDWLRSSNQEVEAFLDMDRHALVFQVMSRGILVRRRSTSAVACYKIRRVYLTLACHRPRDRYCMACHSPIKIEAEPAESRHFIYIYIYIYTKTYIMYIYIYIYIDT